MPSVPLFTSAGARSGEFELPASVWGEKLRVDLVHQAVETELWNRRQGTAKTKDRSEVRGGGRKPYRQKGTGRARQGSTRAPHWRHGGVVHGPETNNYEKKMPQKMRRLAFRSALSAKAADGSVRVVEALVVGKISTKEFAAWLGKLEGGRKVTLVLAQRDENAILSARNLPGVKVIVLSSGESGDRSSGLSTRTVVETETLILTRDAVQKLNELYSDGAGTASAPATEVKPVAKPRAKKAEAPAAEPVAAAEPAEAETAASESEGAVTLVNAPAPEAAEGDKE